MAQFGSPKKEAKTLEKKYIINEAITARNSDMIILAVNIE